MSAVAPRKHNRAPDDWKSRRDPGLAEAIRDRTTFNNMKVPSFDAYQIRPTPRQVLSLAGPMATYNLLKKFRNDNVRYEGNIYGEAICFLAKIFDTERLFWVNPQWAVRPHYDPDANPGHRKNTSAGSAGGLHMSVDETGHDSVRYMDVMVTRTGAPFSPVADRNTDLIMFVEFKLTLELAGSAETKRQMRDYLEYVYAIPNRPERFYAWLLYPSSRDGGKVSKAQCWWIDGRGEEDIEIHHGPMVLMRKVTNKFALSCATHASAYWNKSVLDCANDANITDFQKKWHERSPEFLMQQGEANDEDSDVDDEKKDGTYVPADSESEEEEEED